MDAGTVKFCLSFEYELLSERYLDLVLGEHLTLKVRLTKSAKPSTLCPE